MANPLLLYIVNDSGFFLSHRLPLAVSAKKIGYDVHVATAPGNGVPRIIECGFTHHELPLSRSGRSIFAEFACFLSIWRLMLRLRPQMVHLVTIKPVLYGGIAARLSKVPGMVAAISGLGSLFVASGIRSQSLRFFAKKIYKLALRHPNSVVIFQNSEDRTLLTSIGAVTNEQTTLIPGSGVSLVDFDVHPEPEGVPVVVFAARLLWSKGVKEFIEAARILRFRGVDAIFWIIGDRDPDNPDTVSDEDLNEWRLEGVVELMGYRSDVPDLLNQASVVVLPSYYGEGLPKVLIEAAACGRPVVTTDHPGCRDAIRPGETGLLVPVRDPRALANAIGSLLQDPEMRRVMGLAARKLAEEEFSVERVVRETMDIYSSLTGKASAL